MITAESSALDETHDASLCCCVPDAHLHPDFPIQNLPFGIFSTQADRAPRVGVAIGNHVLDLSALAHLGWVDDPANVLRDRTLNRLLGRPSLERRNLRRRLSSLLSTPQLRPPVTTCLVPTDQATLHLPVAIGDYTDFYAGIHHATNVGRLLRPSNPLLPNYKYVPIGYHGRASSIRPSGTPLLRPWGQCKPEGVTSPLWAPSSRLDYELELGVWIGPGNPLGEPIPVGQASEHIAGYCLLNDWSARDLQAWESQPLGPFLAKSFMTTISPWIITQEALAPFMKAQPPRPVDDPAPLPYLLSARDQEQGALAVVLEVFLSTARMRAAREPAIRLSRGMASDLYWTPAQLVAHHTSNGCNLNPGDLIGTGTISSPGRDGCGSLFELSSGGAHPLVLPNGEVRGFLEDRDTVIMTARAERDGCVPIGFGECSGIVYPAVVEERFTPAANPDM